MNKIAQYDEIYPYLDKGCFLDQATIPEDYKKYFN